MTRERWEDFEADPDTGVIYWAGTDRPVKWVAGTRTRDQYGLTHFKRNVAFLCYYGERVRGYTGGVRTLDRSRTDTRKDNLIMMEHVWVTMPEADREGIPHAEFVCNGHSQWFLASKPDKDKFVVTDKTRAVVLLELDGEVIAEVEVNPSLMATRKAHQAFTALLAKGRRKMDAGA